MSSSTYESESQTTAVVVLISYDDIVHLKAPPNSSRSDIIDLVAEHVPNASFDDFHLIGSTRYSRPTWLVTTSEPRKRANLMLDLAESNVSMEAQARSQSEHVKDLIQKHEMLIEDSSRSLAMMQTVVNDLITKCESISAQFDVLSTKHEVLSTKHEKLASGHSNLEAEYYTDKRPTLLYSALSITSHLLAETAPPTVYAKDEAKYFEKVALLTAGVRPWTERVGKAVLAQPLLEALLEPDSILTFTALIPVADRIVRCHPELNRTAWLRKFMKLEAYDYTRHTNTHGSLPSESTLALEWVFAAYGPVECRTIFNELGSADSDGAAVSQSQLSRFAHFL